MRQASERRETVEGQSRQTNWALLGRAAAYFLPYWRHWLLLLGCVIAAAGLWLIPPLIMKEIIDVAIPSRDGRYLNLLILAMIGIPLLSELIGVAQGYLNTFISQRVMFDLRAQMHSHLQKMSLRFFTGTRTGEIMSRISHDVGAVQGTVTGAFNSILSNVITLTSVVIVMYLLDWRLATASLALLPWFIWPAFRVGDRRRKIVMEVHRKTAEISALLQETLSLSGIILVKSFLKQKYEAARFRRENIKLMSLRMRQMMVGRWYYMFIGLFGAAAPALVYWYGGHRVISGALTIGSVVAFASYLRRLFTPVSRLLRVHIDVQSSISVFERIFEYMDLPLEIGENEDAVMLPPAKGHIVFDRVSFEYLPGEPVLRDVSFEIKPGQLAALVGPTGAGKTTTTYLLPRFYQPVAGSIRIDGLDTRDASLASLREQIGMVTQETFLFHASIGDNIKYARENASEDEIILAAKTAHIHDFICSLPQGYDTIVGERGHRLSGGEKQKVAIARVILKDPRILVLDEATSSLDSRSESLIQEALDLLMTDRTCLVIAHRLSTILSADVILVLDNGRLMERGTHAELLAQQGLYAKLYHEQFERGRATLPEVSCGDGELIPAGQSL